MEVSENDGQMAFRDNTVYVNGCEDALITVFDISGKSALSVKGNEAYLGNLECGTYIVIVAVEGRMDQTLKEIGRAHV